MTWFMAPAAGRAAALRRWLTALTLWAGVMLLPALAQAPPPSPPPAQVQEFMRLLDDPAVRSWLDQARQAPAPALQPSGPVAAEDDLAARLAAARQHVRAVAAAIPAFPAEARRASDRLLVEMNERGPLSILLLVLGFGILGYGSERLFWSATARARAWIASHPAETAGERVRLLSLRLGFGLTLVAIFGLGSIGAFLVLDWPPLLRRIVLGYLVAALITRFTLMVGRVLLTPGSRGETDTDRNRALPIDGETARFWLARLALFVGYFAFGSATVGVLATVGFPPDLRAAAAYTLGLGLLVIAVEAVWRRPSREPHPGAGRTGFNVLLTAYCALLWMIWVAGFNRLFWLGVVSGALPAAISIARSSTRHLMRSASGDATPSIREVTTERGVRALLIVAAALFLADAWGIDLVEMTARDNALTRLLRGALVSVVVLLLADFIWGLAKAAIDARLSGDAVVAPPGSAEAVRQARLRTLLPIVRNILLVVIVVLAALTAISALGVEIGPLIAGAGVVGVAVGFGAQTLVKDVISGIFYLLDDAFRVGEYIQSGSYRGTVDSFSLRSIKLRHHRGPVYTVPFGELGAVQNMSRDWVIDKFQINVTYDTDLEKARKLIKVIGQEMAADPEFAPHIIEPLKMQGVEQFGDFAIQIRMKMTTRPGEQFVIRRKAYARIKQAFDANGIHFAFPTVQVAGGGDAAPAVAHEALQLIRPAVGAVE
jgi:moderate conductance mechanosensitive channel